MILLNERLEVQFYLKFLTKQIILVEILALLHMDRANNSRVQEILVLKTRKMLL
jgi:hypothetical protein